MKSFFASVLRRFQYHFSTIGAIRRGEATLKAYLAGVGTIDYGFLPYPEVIELVREAKKESRRVYLATADKHLHANGIATHLGFFSSDEDTDFVGEAKACVLAKTFGSQGSRRGLSLVLPQPCHARLDLLVLR